MANLESILAAINPTADSPAAVQWGAAAVRLAAGDPSAAIALGVKAILGLFDRPPPVDYCRININPLGLKRKGSGVLATAVEQPTRDCLLLDMWCDYGTKRVPFELGAGADTVSVPVADKPELFHCEGEPSAAIRYPFDRWLMLVGAYDFSGTAITRRPPPKAAEAKYMAAWAILSKDEARKRYRLEAEPWLIRSFASGTTPAQRADLESFYRGRFAGDKWLWGDAAIAGRKVEDLPRWIPLEPEAKSLATIYLAFWDRWGLTDTDLDLLGAANPEVGIGAPGSLARLDPEQRRRTIAQAYLLAAARAKGDGKAFELAKKAIDGQAKAAGVSVNAEDLTRAVSSLGSWFATHREQLQTPEDVKRLSAQTGAVRWVYLGAFGILVLAGAVALALHRRRK